MSFNQPELTFVNVSVRILQTGLSLEQTKDWLHKTIADGKDQEKSGLNLPLRSDGSSYTIDGLAEDQKESLGVVLTALKSYCVRPTGEEQGVLPVSYTHLTLPTICSV